MSLDYFGLQGRRALVTGASSGLGQQFARSLARAGAEVVIAARRVERLEQLAADIAASGGRAVPLGLDVTDRASIEAGFAQLDADGGPPGIVVNNAGVGGKGDVGSYAPENVDRTFDTNIRGVWDVSEAAARRMIDNRIEGSIVNIASICGFTLEAGAASYNVTKAAVVQMTRSMARDLARHNIRVNAIAPGYFPSEMTEKYLRSEAGQAMTKTIPMGRAGRPEELEGALLLLSSPRGSYMTGETIVVDGGHLVAGV